MEKNTTTATATAKGGMGDDRGIGARRREDEQDDEDDDDDDDDDDIGGMMTTMMLGGGLCSDSDDDDEDNCTMRSCSPSRRRCHCSYRRRLRCRAPRTMTITEAETKASRGGTIAPSSSTAGRLRAASWLFPSNTPGGGVGTAPPPASYAPPLEQLAGLLS